MSQPPGDDAPIDIDGVLCDIDGVLRQWDPDTMPRLDRAYGLPAGTLAAAAFHPQRVGPAVTGLVTDAEWRAAVAADLVPACGSAERAAAIVAEWAALAGQVDETVLGLLTAARRRVPVILVSNATTRLEAELARLGLDGAADGVVNSSRVGVAKPDQAIYRIAAERAGVPASRCLFVDDAPANVAGALAVGMTGLHYTKPSQLRDALAGLGPGPR